MLKKDRDKLISKELEQLLIKMHDGESLTTTLNKIMDTIGGIRYLQERQFIFMLEGLYQEKMGGLPDITEDKNKIEGYNEAVDENNFAVDIAMSAIKGEE